jgi:hypothetical protein
MSTKTITTKHLFLTIFQIFLGLALLGISLITQYEPSQNSDNIDGHLDTALTY